ncbi:kinase-like protein [Aspergillus vadensis CBS 113365]|uniref:Kinase-like protein n=1 Tax=Aspergillus vadensis (strain CBS 113365 / IMI 142717 / IBT 24658) TaxID=1448311 RepID=A0A319BC98_ASPVC|nr:kinase-like protein [Aspergillus vadensis CBS 113365]PYH68300.1 kinase-like protein [Aspergillus vadensis CBS 113365]
MRNPCLLLRQPLRLTVPFPCYGLPHRASQPFFPHPIYRASSLTSYRGTVPANEIPRVLYEPIEDVERMEYYEAGGYHPVTIGDCFHHRYRVVHKLGHGTYSTIWLARDEVSNRYVALKICTADSNPLENSVLSRLSQPQKSPHIDRDLIPTISEIINIQGPNGKHTCLLTRPARTSLSDAKNGSWNSLFQLEVSRAIVAQLIIAVQYIHSQGIVHGDLHRGNILLRLSRDFDELSTDMLYEIYGEPVLEPVNRLDGQGIPPEVPQHGVVPIWLGAASEDVMLLEAKICLSDFGEAFCPRQERKFESHTPLLVRPPEARFEPYQPLTFSSDIWTLACTIWDIMGQRTLFEGLLTNDDDMTSQQVDLLGPLPSEWLTKRREIRVNRSKSKNRFEQHMQQSRIREGMSPFESKERDAFISMLRSMLRFRPEDRPFAQQVLESEWMVKWELPEYEKICSSN